MVRPRSCRVIYYFDTPVLGRRHQSFGRASHHAPQCENRNKNNNPPKTKVNLVEGEDIIAVIVSQVNMVINEKYSVVATGATRHICANKEFFSTYTPFKYGEEVHLEDSRIANVLGKGKVLLKLTSGKKLGLNEVLHVPNIRANLVFVVLFGKFRIKVSFKSDKIVMIKNNVFMWK